ncbi:MAG TPA: protein-L-isoaspartate(D-aspartate) O-methyltransferase [Myxococcota bacterium]|jgi:protein-L-isoaspartate(D-aspartate) O-methyltransferase|nr:protein-L-isoaspartate(D-aspartate) O-methyltransferase [Myxococcota bacterium]
MSDARADGTHDARRQEMVERQIRGRGVTDERVLAAMLRVPRERFVAPELARLAYDDAPLPIGEGQTISQPYMVAAMTAALGLRGDERVLEIGTGSGYQTAVLAALCAEVWSVERLPELAARAQRVLGELGCTSVRLRTADGSLGWPEGAPYDGILVAAGAPRVPPALLAQLRAPRGRLVVPVGDRSTQVLTRVVRTGDGPRDYTSELLDPCRFVDLLGAEGWPE